MCRITCNFGCSLTNDLERDYCVCYEVSLGTLAAQDLALDQVLAHHPGHSLGPYNESKQTPLPCVWLLAVSSTKLNFFSSDYLLGRYFGAGSCLSLAI